MAARSRHASAYDAFDDEDQYGPGELMPGERIGRPLARSGRKAMLRGLIILTAAGGGWMLLGGQTSWPDGLPAEIAAVFSSIERRIFAPAEPVRSTLATTSSPADAGPTTKPAALDPLPPLPTTSSKSSATPGAGTAYPAAPQSTAALPATAAPSGEDQPAAPLPPPVADPADPYQTRALAVGLHPELSRVLLTRLSPTDYRNAGIAIQTAMAETADSAVFVWPRQRTPELALFRVHFVPGAAPGCRRYVVTVTKDGWLTTALPMEKCGPQLSRPRAG